MLQRYLPVELTDAIIDYLHADHIALAACSLVCRAWRGAAQHHLLAIIHCVGDELEQLLTQIEAQDGSSRVEDDRSCIENSDSQFVDGERVSGVADEKGISASFATHVRELYVCGPQPVRPSFRLPQFNIRIATMARVLREFPNLHTLHLKRLILKPSNTAQARDGQGAEGLETRRRYRLRWLDLRTVYLTNTETLSEMLGLCAEVRDLTLNSVSFWNGGFAEEEEEAERTRGESLGINGQSPAAFEMQGMLRVDGLKTCEVKFPLPECVPMVLEMLGGAAASLENLTLHLFSTDDIPRTFHMISLSKYNLNPIKQFGNLLMRSPGPNSHISPWFSRIGSATIPSSLPRSYLSPFCCRTSLRPYHPSNLCSMCLPGGSRQRILGGVASEGYGLLGGMALRRS